MKILPEPIAFEWDKGNKEKNFKKHKVSIKEAEDVFYSKQKFFFVDKKHSTDFEKRHMVWGISSEQRKLSVIFTVRGKVRIISARDMNKKERREYEKKVKNNSKV